MSICRLAWENFILEVHTSTELQPSITAKQNRCGVYFSIMHPMKVVTFINVVK